VGFARGRTNHSNSPLILVDNRDEFFERPTAPAYWWEPGSSIYAPQDLESPSRGTWIGVTKSGRFAVLVNSFETEKKSYELSRGELPKLFLESDLAPREWIEWVQKQEMFHKSGGFALLVGTAAPVVHYEFVSNHDRDLPQPDQTVALSNGTITDSSWTKVRDAMTLFEPLLSIDNQADLIQRSFALLNSSAVAPETREDLRKSIFIPPTRLRDTNGTYGTRTQTVVLIDTEGQLTFVQRDVKTNSTHAESFHIDK